MKIVILDGAGANPGEISWAPLERFGEVTAYDYTSKEQVVERASGAEICITNILYLKGMLNLRPLCNTTEVK